MIKSEKSAGGSRRPQGRSKEKMIGGKKRRKREFPLLLLLQASRRHDKTAVTFGSSPLSLLFRHDNQPLNSFEGVASSLRLKKRNQRAFCLPNRLVSHQQTGCTSSTGQQNRPSNKQAASFVRLSEEPQTGQSVNQSNQHSSSISTHATYLPPPRPAAP
jgi:hypothetical protein